MFIVASLSWREVERERERAMWFFVALCLISIIGIKSDDASVISLAADPCPRGWTHVSQIDQCYIIPDVFLPWADAQAYCQNVTGGNLVSIYSQFEYDTLLSRFESRGENI